MEDDDVEKEEDDALEEDDVEEENRSQDRDPHCKPAQSKRMSRFHTSHLTRKFTGKMSRTKMSPERRRTLCTSLHGRNACQDVTRATLYGNLQAKCRRPKLSPERRQTLGASLRGRNACQDFTTATLYENCR